MSSKPAPDPAPIDLPGEETEEPAVVEVPVDGEALRQAMRRIATPVVVVTAEAEGAPRGATIGSFVSVSLAPPLISFNVTRKTRAHDALTQSERFAVHFLAAEHAELASHFALPHLTGEEQFAPFAHRRSTGGHPPILDDMLGVLICRSESRFAVGDHSIFVGSVVEVLPGRDGDPLLYHRRSYRGVGDEV
ncbi:MAG: flavin reductase family protein [Rubricoccaceae bacterium]|nr:flavin reductase family protein [Rubricoccaceae bacterium]